MSYEIVITDAYKKRLVKFLKKHPEMLSRYAKAMVILENDPYHPSLRLHKLKGKLQEYHSVSINMAYRVIIDFIIRDDRIIPIDIGSHDEDDALFGLWKDRELDIDEHVRSMRQGRNFDL